jgi:hypothetical protein
MCKLEFARLVKRNRHKKICKILSKSNEHAKMLRALVRVEELHWGWKNIIASIAQNSYLFS